MNTIREQIVQRLVQLLENITLANGYQSDIGPVYRCQPVSEIGNEPVAVVWELEQTHSRTKYDTSKRVLLIRIEALTYVRSEPSHDANCLLGDIEKAILSPDATLDSLITEKLDVRTELARTPAGQNITGIALELQLHYEVKLGNPYVVA